MLQVEHIDQVAGACPGPGPPLEIEKQKKVIRANFKLFHLYFATFFSRKYHFIWYFLSCPPLEILKSKEKKKIIRANFKLVHLYLATFLVGNIILSAIF